MGGFFRKLFIEVNSGRIYSLTILRVFLVVLLMIIWVMLHRNYENLPHLEDAKIYQGILVDARNPARGRRSIVVEAPEKEVLLPFFYHNWEKIDASVGKRIEVWKFRRTGIFLFPEDVYIELKVEGEAMINWNKRRSEIIEERPAEMRFFYLLIVIFLLTIVAILNTNRMEK